MARGSEAKKKIIAKLKEAYGSDFVGESNNKYYLWETENNERVQIAVSLTCPKTPIGEIKDDSAFTNPLPPAPDITEEEKENISNLFARLGL